MKTTLFSLIAVLSIVIIGCSDMQTGPVQPQAMTATYNPDDSYLQSGAIGERPNRDSLKKDTVKKATPTIFGELLVKLNLTPEQKPVVEKLLAEHKSCIENCTKALKDAEREILMNARVKEEEIKKAVEAGTLSKADARQQLGELKKSVNEQLRSLPIRAKVQECVKSCDAAFINGLENILTPQQKIVLKTWLEIRAKRGTTPTGGGPQDGGPTGGKDTTNTKGRG